MSSISIGEPQMAANMSCIQYGLPVLSVEAVQEAAEVGEVDQAVLDRRGGDRAADLVEVPELPALRDVAALGGVDRVGVADAFAVLRILAVRDVDDVLEDDRRADHFVARLRPHRVLGVGVELPELLAASAPRSRAPSRRPARARPACTPPMSPTAGVDHWPWRMRSSTELSSHTSLPVLVSMAMIDGAFGDGMLTWLSSWPFGAEEDQVLSDTGDELDRLCGNEPTSSIMSNDPDEVRIVLAGQLLVLERAVVVLVVEALEVGRDHLAAVGHEIGDARR